MLTDSLLNRNFDMNLAPHSTVGWLEDGQNFPEDAFLSNSSPAAGRLGHDRARYRGRTILTP
jgi:hypothetical protein